MQGLECESKIVLISALIILGNLVYEDNEHAELLSSNGILHNLDNLLYSSDEEVVNISCWVLSNMCASSIHCIEKVMNLKLDAKLIQKLSDSSEKVKTEALWCISNITIHSNFEIAN